MAAASESCWSEQCPGPAACSGLSTVLQFCSLAAAPVFLPWSWGAGGVSSRVVGAVTDRCHCTKRNFVFASSIQLRISGEDQGNRHLNSVEIHRLPWGEQL